MKGDFSRSVFGGGRYSRVIAQQDRLQLDYDWNEQQQLVARQIRVALADIFGQGQWTGVAVAPFRRPGFGLHTHEAATFERTSPLHDLESVPTLGGSEPFTIEAWVMLPVDGPRGGTIVSRMQAGRPAVGECSLRIDDRGCVVFERVENASPPRITTIASRSALGGGSFSQIVAVFTGSAMELFIDGVLQRRCVARGGATNATLPLRIGAGSASDGSRLDPFIGAIEAVSISRERRRPHEIEEHFVRDERAHTGDALVHWKAGHITHGAPERATRVLCVSPGRCYVDGRLCENTRHETSTIDAKLLQGREGALRLVAYLDVWERYVSAFEDASIGDVALGGIDTTGRLQTVARVHYALHPENHRHTVARVHERGEIAVDTGSGILQDNLLYRFEVHASGSAATVEPLDETTEQTLSADVLPGIGPNGERTLRVSGTATLASGHYLQAVAPVLSPTLMRVLAVAPADGSAAQTVRVDALPSSIAAQARVRVIAGMVWSKENAHLVFTVSGEPEAGATTSLVRINDEAGRADALSIGSIVVVTDMEREQAFLPGDVGRIISIATDIPERVTVEMSGTLARTGTNPTLRRWDGIVPADASVASQPAGDLAVRFAPGGTFRTGDFWNVATRPGAVDPLDWERDVAGEPAFMPPAGIEHTFAPLAYLRVTDDEITVDEDLRRIVRSFGDAEPIVVIEDESVSPDDRGAPEPTPEIVIEPPTTPFPLGALVLANHAIDGFVPTGGVVDTRVAEPVWHALGSDPAATGPAQAATIGANIFALFDSGTLWRLALRDGAARWHQCQPYDAGRIGHIIVASAGRLFVIGGRDTRGKPLRNVDEYDPIRDAWSYATSAMNVARAEAAAAGDDDRIIVCGGIRRTAFGMRYASKAVEEYDIATNRWHRLDDMPVRRFGSAAAFVGNAYFLIGGVVTPGFGSLVGPPSARVDVFRSWNGQWTNEHWLREARVGARATVIADEEIVVAGGSVDGTSIGTERIHLMPPRIERAAKTARTGFGFAAHEGIVYAVGGSYAETADVRTEASILRQRLRIYRPRADDAVVKAKGDRHAV